MPAYSSDARVNSADCIRVHRPVRTLSAAIFLCFLALSGVARAECERNGVKLFPSPNSVVPTNAQFLLEGIGREQERVSRLVGKTLLMTSGQNRVSVQVRPGFRSEVGRVTVVLVPSAPLAPSETWGLVLADVLEGAELLNWSGSDVLYPQWKVGSRSDDRPPVFERPPAAASAFHQEGSRGVRFRMTLKEDSPSFLIATVRRARGSTALQRYPVMVNGGEVVLGHDTCSGSFTWEDGRAYRVLFDAVDSAGNRSLTAPPVEFQAPVAVSK